MGSSAGADDLRRDSNTAPSDAVVIAHVDESLIVAVKPAGLLSVPGRGVDRQDCLARRIHLRYDDARVVHRLDMATSGLVLFARGAEAQRRLSRAFAERQVEKRYIAIVAGRLLPERGEIDLPLMADWPRRPRQRVDLLLGKPSLTRYRVTAIDAAGAWSRVELEPVTGRAHQLRVHLLAIGHPVLGDALYAPADVQAQSERLMLHAERLAFDHPGNGERCVFESTAPF